MRKSGTAVAATALALVLAGCGGSSSGGNVSNGDGASGVTGTVNVFAASSLTEAFTTLGKQFESAHPGVKVVFDYGPSSGACRDRSPRELPRTSSHLASTTNMDQVVSAGGGVGTPIFRSSRT